jgi:ketosteroid isomerase-like protein
MNDSTVLIRHFYQAFNQCDWQRMADCYADDAKFYDPVFQDLDATQVRTMWRMLLEGASGLVVNLTDVSVQGDKAQAIWDARYLFAKTGRPVHNQVTTHFSFRDDKILTHVDDFDLWRWSAQALGWPGRLFGWTIFMRSKIRDQAQAQLKRYSLKLGAELDLL